MKGLLKRLTTRKPVEAKPDLAVMIARRAQRVGNRSAGAAAKYETTHGILAKGKRNG